MKEQYLDIIERSMAGYPELDELGKLEMTDDIQAYARITAVTALLAAAGRWKHRLPLACDMLSVCLRSLIPDNRLNDYAVKDIMIAYKYLKAHADGKTLSAWQTALRGIDPEIHYVIFENKKWTGHIHNVNIYNMAAEHLRLTEGFVASDAFVDRHFERQLAQFDENGMYHDPNDPLLYDLAARVQLLYILGYGYSGPYRDRADAMIRRGALTSLRLQSAAFELPYGGRSAQFLFNEAFVCSMAEYEAARYKREGDLALAGQFKRCARLSAESVSRWIEADPPRHIKNFFPIETKAGTEGYGYYNKYMASLGIFLHLAYEFCDETIPELPCPAETGGILLDLPCFHKIVANCGGYSLEIDTAADYHYDATGLGRLHRRGVPTELAVSVPFSRSPKYKLLGGGMDLSLSAGWRRQDGDRFLSERENTALGYTLGASEISAECVSYVLTYRVLRDGERLSATETHTLTGDGLTVRVENGEATVLYRIPLLVTNGKDEATSRIEGDTLVTRMNGYCYRLKTDAEVILSDQVIYNRNGAYRFALLVANGGQLSFHASLGADEEA